MLTLRAPFWLSLTLHGVGVGVACWLGVGTRPVPVSMLRVDVLPADTAPVCVEEPPPQETATVEVAASSPPLELPRALPLAPVEPEVYRPPLETEFAVLPASPPLACLATVVRRPASAATTSPPAAAEPARAAPAARVLEVLPGSVPPVYPVPARRHRWEGVVVILVHVDADGRVGNAVVERSSGHDELDQAALAAVRGWRYSGGPGETTEEVEFRLR